MIGRVLFEAEMRSTLMIIPAVSRDDTPEMHRVDDDHVIETLSSDRAEQVFDVPILPGTCERGDNVVMPMPASRRSEGVAVVVAALAF